MRSTTTIAVFLATLAGASVSHAERTAQEYRFFRALSIDLLGRMPTVSEIDAFEAPSFDVERWVDQHMTTAPYAERMRRVYSERLRLELSTAAVFRPRGVVLRRIPITHADGTREWVYFRAGQRRDNREVDGTMCFTPQELGVQYPATNVPPVTSTCNTPRRMTEALINSRTRLVTPWWSTAQWDTGSPYNARVAGMMQDPEGMPLAGARVRVCNEEASASVSGRPLITTTNPAPATGCNQRLVGAPNTNAQAMRVGETTMLSCSTATGMSLSSDCGCGAALERCIPGAAVNNLSAGAFTAGVTRAPLGNEQQLEPTSLSVPTWNAFWWAQEASHFIEAIFRDDRDVRQMLTGRDTVINGPLAQFYRYGQSQTCCTSNHSYFNYDEPTNLFNAASVPASLQLHEAERWVAVADRGSLASGILTMPVFLTKYGTRRARAHVLYQAFLCKEFVAPNAALTPSEEPDLTRRSGCSGCHATLEPLSAYFTRVTESDWTYLPAARFPLDSAYCRLATAGGAMAAGCAAFYDPSFATTGRSWLRGVYNLTAAQPRADAGPRGAGAYFTAQPEFAPCVVENVAESFLGRELDAEDAALRTQLQQALTTGGMRARAMVRTLLLSNAYRHANNLSPSAAREAEGL